MTDNQETHPLFVPPLIEIEGPISWGRYHTKFRTRWVGTVEAMAERKQLEFAQDVEGTAHCCTGAMSRSFTIVADNIVTQELPSKALLLLEVVSDPVTVTCFLTVSELHNCHMSFNNGKLTLTEAGPNEWVFDVQETGVGLIPNPDSPPFNITVHVLQDNSDSYFRDLIQGVARSAAAHVRLLLPETNLSEFDQEAPGDVFTQMEHLTALYRSGQHRVAEQTIRQIILACATRHASI